MDLHFNADSYHPDKFIDTGFSVNPVDYKSNLGKWQLKFQYTIANIFRPSFGFSQISIFTCGNPQFFTQH
jgi:hypothetical protein